jgi:hypothetical protein
MASSCPVAVGATAYPSPNRPKWYALGPATLPGNPLTYHQAR